MASIEAARFNALKARVKAECARRCYTGSVETYAGTKYDYTKTPAADRIAQEEHYEKLAVPMHAINSTNTAQTDGNRIISDAELTEMEALITAYETRTMTDRSGKGDCSASCTGACYTGCTGTCTGGCQSGCSNTCTGTCSGGCSSTCKNTCSGSCSSCTGTCTGSCYSGCYGCSGTCSGSCTSCTGGCDSDCTVTCGYQGCVGQCVSSCYNGCTTGCNTECGTCGNNCTAVSK